MPGDRENHDDIIPLAPLDEQDEILRREEIAHSMELQRDIISETGGPLPIPLEHREDLTSEDLEHFVVNYCLDKINGQSARLGIHVDKLRQFPSLARQAIENFQTGRSQEQALAKIPQASLARFLAELADRL